jgi:hypothetical protein
VIFLTGEIPKMGSFEPAAADPVPLADDLLRGCVRIAEFLGESERRTFYLLQTGQIPAGKVGAVWIASKSALRSHFWRLTRAQAR